MSRRLRPTYLHHQRTNAGIVMPQFVLHAALAPLTDKLRAGTYGRDAQEERLFTNLSQDTEDACFHALQQRPPGVSLQFPRTPQQLPMITIVQEEMPTEAPIIGDDAGEVEEELESIETDTVLTPTGGAIGGETSFILPVSGELVTRMVDLEIRHVAGTVTELDSTDDFTVDADTKTITLLSALVAGDVLVATRFGYYTLPGGDLYANTFRFRYVIFVTTENTTLTAFLVGLVWRELVMQHDEVARSGLVDLDYQMRGLSLWDQAYPSIGERSEFLVEGLCDWVVYKRTQATRGVVVDLDSTDGTESVLEAQFELGVFDETEEDCT